MSRASFLCAAMAVAVAFAVSLPAAAAAGMPSDELVVNGDFEAGLLISSKTNSGNYLEGLTVHTSGNAGNEYFPGWNTVNCVKAKASGTYVASGIDIERYAICTKTSSSATHSYFWQDVVVPEAGIYRLYFDYGGRPKSGSTVMATQNITVFLSEVVDDAVEVERAVVPTFSNSSTAKQTFDMFLDLTPGTWRLKFDTEAAADRSTWFNKISLKRVDTLLVNGSFDESSLTDHSGQWSYSSHADFSCPGWNFTNGGLAKNNAEWVAGMPLGNYAAFIQSTSDVSGTAMWQDVTVTEPGIYTLEFKYAARPNSNTTGQIVNVLFGRLTEEKTDLDPAADLVETFASIETAKWTLSKNRVAALQPGTYRVKITGISPAPSRDTATAIDFVRLGLDGELVENGDFEDSVAISGNYWGGYMSNSTSMKNPGWTPNPASSVGLGNPFGVWITLGLKVGKYGMYLQSVGTTTTAHQDIRVSIPGKYTLKYNYTARSGFAGQQFSTSFGLLENGTVAEDLAGASFTASNATTVDSWEKTGMEVRSAGDYRLKFQGSSGKNQDRATAVDCVSLKREPNYVFWTGGGDGATISDPANWGVESISYADDFVFTNEAPLTVNLTADFAGASLNFTGTGAVTLNGVVEDGGNAVTNALTVGTVYSVAAAPAVLFNCPVNFADGYDVASISTNKFALGVTATGWQYAQGPGGCALDGDFTFTADTLAISGDAVVLDGSSVRAVNMTGVDDDSITLDGNAKVFLSGDLTTASGTTHLLAVNLAEASELWITNGTALASIHYLTATRTKGTVNVQGVVLNTAGEGTGLYAGRMNIGAGGVSCNGNANGIFLSVTGIANTSGEMTFGAFADWTWAQGGNGTLDLYLNTFVFDTLDCFDGETPRTVTLAAATTAAHADASVIRKINPGTLVLAASNYFNGGLQVEGGTVSVTADCGSGFGPATVASGATLEAVSGGILRNSSITVADGGTLALANGGYLAAPVTASGEVRVKGTATIAPGGLIAIASGGSLAFGEGAKIAVSGDVPEGTTIVTGAGLTAQDLAERFIVPAGRVALDASGNVVYTSSTEWISGAVWADDGIYFRYANAVAAGYVTNILSGAEVVASDIVRYVESTKPGNAAGNSNVSVLFDGDVLMHSARDWSKTCSMQKGIFTFTFPQPTNIAEIALFTFWGNGGRDGIAVSNVLVQTSASSEWMKICPVTLSVGVNNNSSSHGAMVAVLRLNGGSAPLENVTALKVCLPAAQDNNGTGYTEIAAFENFVPDGTLWTWNGNAGNALFSDAGNWQDSSGAAAGSAGDAFAPGGCDSIAVPSSTQITVDVPVEVTQVLLGGGVTLSNPAADPVTGEVATNTIVCGTILNSGAAESVFDCAVRFTDTYNVAATNVIRFAGGASAKRLGTGLGGSCHALAGDITIESDFDQFYYGADAWSVTDGSRLTAGVLKKNATSDNVNGTPNFRICEGGYAHFTSITSGRDRLTVSVQGELEVDGYYDTMSVIVASGKSKGTHYAGDFGYPGDQAYAGSTVRAGGICRRRYTTNTTYSDYMTYCYPANYYIGSLGIGLEYKDYSVEFTGCPKHIYATDDFSIYGSTASSSNVSDWGVNFVTDTTLDTQGHTVTWTAGAVLRNSPVFTKAGEGTLIMAPRGASISANVNDVPPSVIVAGGTLEARSCLLAPAATPIFDATVPVTVKDGATLRITEGCVTAVSNPIILEEGATLDIDAASNCFTAMSVGSISATGTAKVKVSGVISDSAFATGTNIVIAASCDAATLANLSIDPSSDLKYENEHPCRSKKLVVEDGKLCLAVKVLGLSLSVR